jgi:glycosyltransferase involved in cell wall biosynthesis
MRATAVVVPRERFTSLPGSLRSLFRTIPADVPVVVVEGASPAATRAELAVLLRERPFELVSFPYMVKPNEARNIGVSMAETEYVVIADNDVEYEPGWFEEFRRHALEYGSDAVAALTCVGPPPATIIHQAGGVLEAVRTEEGIALFDRHRLAEVPLADATLPGMEHHVCELHCLLVRRSLLEELGGLDERLVSREQVDLALRLLVLEARVTFAKDAVVTYMARDVFDPVDLRYLLFRWSDRFVVESLDAFESTWDVSLDRDDIRYAWAAEHRLRGVETTYPRLRRILDKERFRRFVVRRLEQKVLSEQLRARAAIVPAVPKPLARERVERALEDLVEATGRGALTAR